MFMKKLWNLKINPYDTGKIAEFLCRIYMRFCGYRIVAKNYRCGSGKKNLCGELDFIAKKGKRIVFCEVKKRAKNSDFLRALSNKQQERIIHGGEYFMKHHPQYHHYKMQFDVFFVKLPCSISRVQNALYDDRIR